MKKIFTVSIVFILSFIFLISAVKAQDNFAINSSATRSDGAIDIYWATNYSTICNVIYSYNLNLSNGVNVPTYGALGSDGQYHFTANLNSLVNSNDYYYQVSCTNDNQTILSDVKLVSRFKPALNAKSLLAVAMSSSTIKANNSAALYWNTNLKTSCNINYGTSSDFIGGTRVDGTIYQYGTATNDGKFDFVVNLSKLATSTDYYYLLHCSTSDGQNFTSQVTLLPKYASVVKPVVTVPKVATSTKATSTSPVVVVKNPVVATSTVDVLAPAKQQFQKIYLRSFNSLNSNDGVAIKIMTYGLKSVGIKRNLKSEAAAIKTFKNIYKYLPKSSSDWNIVAAIAYSGAKR
ncbi:MAG: hypothetical protein WCK37_00310 [Candidatus Falkowbacteria bacterium]